jgi:spermidine synthase
MLCVQLGESRHGAGQKREDSRALVRSFLDVFPYASLWTTEAHEMLLVGSPDPIELHAERETLSSFYAAALAAYRGDRAAWARAMALVMRDGGDNPYYRWIAGDTE